MKQTKPHTEWHAKILRQVRRQAEALLNDFAAQPAAKTHAGVERAAKALLAIARLADVADAHTASAESLPDIQVPAQEPAEAGRPPLNRQERRRRAAEARHLPARLPVSTVP